MMLSEIMLGFDGLIASVNSTIFHSEQLYWNIVLQNSITFFIHSLKILSSHNSTEGYTSSFLSIDANPNEFIANFDMPIDDLSQICIDDINQEYKSRTLYYPNSMPGF